MTSKLILLENLVPRIDVAVEFNQSMLKFTHERRNRLQRKRRVQQREQPSLHNDTLQLFRDEDASAQDNGIMEKWTQYVGSTARKCGSKNDQQSRGTTTHNFLCDARMAKFYC
jgi:hypothetical protein